MINVYRRKSVQVEAMQWDGSAESAFAIMQWAGGALTYVTMAEEIQIHTPEGIVRAWPRDWVVRDGNGDFHPVGAEMFLKNYEPIAGTVTPDLASG